MVMRNPESGQRSNPPMFNAPPIVAWMIGIFFGIHIIRQILPHRFDIEVLINFSFIPIKYTGGGNVSLFEKAAGLVGHMFLHGDFVHVGFNSLWFLVFATPLARRWRPRRLIFFFLSCGVAGALFHLLLYPSSSSPLIGASGGVAALMGAAVRFAVFAPGGMSSIMQFSNTSRGPILPISDRRVLAFSGVWIAINLVFGIGASLGGGAIIAWDVHLMGYLAGMVLFPWFDGYRQGSAGDGGKPNGKDRSNIRIVK